MRARAHLPQVWMRHGLNPNVAVVYVTDAHPQVDGWTVGVQQYTTAGLADSDSQIRTVDSFEAAMGTFRTVLDVAQRRARWEPIADLPGPGGDVTSLRQVAVYWGAGYRKAGRDPGSWPVRREAAYKVAVAALHAHAEDAGLTVAEAAADTHADAVALADAWHRDVVIDWLERDFDEFMKAARMAPVNRSEYQRALVASHPSWNMLPIFQEFTLDDDIANQALYEAEFMDEDGMPVREFELYRREEMRRRFFKELETDAEAVL